MADATPPLAHDLGELFIEAIGGANDGRAARLIVEEVYGPATPPSFSSSHGG